MKFAEDPEWRGNLIRAYSDAGIVIGARTFRQSLIVSAEIVIDSWRPASIAELRGSDFDPVVELDPEVILLGTGRRQQFPAPALYQSLVARGKGLEIMDTLAACRTFNILSSEGRGVIAALIIEP